SPEAARGALAAAGCYLIWGLVPLYWRLLAGNDATELIAHRALWSLAFLAPLVAAQRLAGEIRAGLATPRALGANLLSAALLTGNWLVYVWAVNTGHVIESSLGYFLVPLVNVALGRFVLHERLRRLQWLAIACAAAGVLLMIAQLGRLPWIALGLAGTFGAYGLMRKKSPLGSLAGLTVEALLMAPCALALLLWQHHTGAGALGRADAATHALLVSSGVITAIPLLLFGYGARRIRLTTLGLLQYLGPTVQFALGVWVFHEPFSLGRASGFVLIWAGLALYTVDNLRGTRARP
ncbi:MAG: EamA family transporter RarD, partial [Opitutaceae bacterium]|nr:EamA family transporter RarD [Opitutaceae bacterium]